MRSIPEEAQSAFIQVSLNEWEPSLVVDLLNYIVDRLKTLKKSGITEFKELRRILELLIKHLPDEFVYKPEGWRKALVKPISATIFFTDFPQKFISIRKLIAIDLRDPRPTCKLLCRALNEGLLLSELEYETLFPHLRNLMLRDVDTVMKFIEEMRDFYLHNAGVESFLQKLEIDLKIVGLNLVKGPSLRKQYVTEIVGSGIIDQKSPILIVGESGTSKTFLAEKIALNSRYKNYAVVNCAGKARQELIAALDAALMLPTTILLDEVYALPLKIQEFSLAEFNRLGSDMRIISTSSDPIEVLQQKLKSDFFNRIYSGWLVRLKPLSESRPDVEEAIKSLVEDKYQMGIDDRVVEHLRDSHSWPDNFRGIERVMQTLCLKCKSKGVEIISVEILAELRPELDEGVLRILKPLV
jgi:hypothetical protein